MVCEYYGIYKYFSLMSYRETPMLLNMAISSATDGDHIHFRYVAMLLAP